VVNRADSVKVETLQDWLDQRLEVAAMPISAEYRLLRSRSGLAHRLDKETSGCLLVGKTPDSLRHLLAQFKQREIGKEYLALVHGRLEPDGGIIRLPIGRDSYNRHKWRVDPEGKQAQTTWQTEAFFQGESGMYTLVRLFPQTGRTHQIRVHMSHLGHPLVSDERYLNKKRYKADQKLLKRHFLHAAKLTFNHPKTGKSLTVQSPIPDDLRQTLEQLKAVS
jgi:23S rRNA pseudouridine1911/1915/1917 synthase